MFNAKDIHDVLRRKIKTFRQDPVGSVLSKGRDWFGWFLLPPFQSWAKHQLCKRGYLEFLKHRPPHAIPPDFADLWFLYETVRRRKPRCILEFGSGCSTVILAQALYDNRRNEILNTGYLYSVDADPYWAEVTFSSMQQHLQGLYEIWYSPYFR
jgi:hypothetical protein